MTGFHLCFLAHTLSNGVMPTCYSLMQLGDELERVVLLWLISPLVQTRHKLSGLKKWSTQSPKSVQALYCN